MLIRQSKLLRMGHPRSVPFGQHALHTAPDIGGNSGAPIPAAPKLPSEGWSDPARFCWNRNTRRAGGRSSLSYAPASRRSGGQCAPATSRLSKAGKIQWMF